MLRRPTISTRTYTLFPYTTLFLADEASGRGGDLAWPSVRARIVVPADLCCVPRAVRRIARMPASGRDGGDDHAAAPSVRRARGGRWRAHHDPQRLFRDRRGVLGRSEEHTSELQSLMRISYAVFCLKKKKPT